MTDEILIYADHVCPFCYLGRRSLERYREQRDEPLAVRWHPFDLRRHRRDGDHRLIEDVDDGHGDDYYDRVRDSVDRLRDEYDADDMLGIDDLPDGVDSFPAQAASLWVRDERPDDWAAFDGAVYDALWLEGRDIGDPDVIEEIATEFDLDPAAVRDATTSDEQLGRLRALCDDAAREGVSGVPQFVYGEHAARGAVPPEQLRRLVEGV
mgnify:CR=1 FL=1